MATAVLVLAIIADVLAVPAAIGAFAFGSFLANSTGGALGTNVLGGGILGLVAAAMGIGGTAVARRRPKLAAMLLGTAGVAGAIGTLAFLPATALYIVAALLALFAQPIPALSLTVTGSGSPAGASRTAAAHLGSAPAASAASERIAARRIPSIPPIGRRLGLAAGGITLVVALVGLATTARGDDELAVARTLFAAIEKHDEVALAQVLPDSSRTTDIAGDAARALSVAFDGTGLSLLSTEWTGRIAQASGAEIRFERLTFASLGKNDERARVRATGTFAPRHENPLINAGLGLLKRPFQVDLALVKTPGGWRIDAPPVAFQASAPPSAPGTTVTSRTLAPTVSATPVQSAPTTAPTPTPSPAPTAPPFQATWTADFNDPSGSGLLPAGVEDRSYSLRYQGGHAILGGCERDRVSIEPLPCYWGVTRPDPGFSAITATAEADAVWGLVFRATGGTDWTIRRRLDSALFAWILPGRGQYGLSLAERDGTTRFTGVASGTSPAVRAEGPNTLELRIEGAQVVFVVNGTEVLRRSDPQGRVGLGFGVSINPGVRDSASLDLWHFAGR